MAVYTTYYIQYTTVPVQLNKEDTAWCVYKQAQFWYKLNHHEHTE